MVTDTINVYKFYHSNSLSSLQNNPKHFSSRIILFFATKDMLKGKCNDPLSIV